MMALLAMENPFWEWLIAPLALMSLGFWFREACEWFLDRSDADTYQPGLRYLIECAACGRHHEVGHMDWCALACQGCGGEIPNPQGC